MDPGEIGQLLTVLEFAVLSREPDGTFRPIGALPDWFAHLSRDQTFPFLGGFLDDAEAFWRRPGPGRIGSGLCTVADEKGREFHVEVWAVSLRGRKLLAFERPASAHLLQKALQGARAQALQQAYDDRPAARAAADTGIDVPAPAGSADDRLSEVLGEVRRSVGALRFLVTTGRPAEEPPERTFEAVRIAVDTLSARLDALERK